MKVYWAIEYALYAQVACHIVDALVVAMVRWRPILSNLVHNCLHKLRCTTYCPLYINLCCFFSKRPESEFHDIKRNGKIFSYLANIFVGTHLNSQCNRSGCRQDLTPTAFSV